MKFHNAAIAVNHCWSSPFVRWQGSLADVSSLDGAAAVTQQALARRGVGEADLDGVVVGMSIPQSNSFYAAPWLASRTGLPGLSGPTIAQACATSVACLSSAAFPWR